MSERNRRGFLVCCAGVLGALAGCTGDSVPRADEETPASTTPTSADQTPTETATGHPDADSLSFNHAAELHRTAGGFPQRDVATYYLALLQTADQLDSFPVDRFENETAVEFLESTDASQSSIVLLQDRKGSSHPDLQLRTANREGATVTIEAEYPGQGGTGDITPNTLLVRVPKHEGWTRGARATIFPQYGDPIRFSTANVYDKIPEFGDPGDLLVRNRDCETTSLWYTVTYEGDLFARESVELPPVTSRSVADLVTHAGEWSVETKANGDSRSQTWSLTDTPPGDLLVDVAGDGSVALSHEPDGVERGDLEGCATDDYPYESSNPAENVDPPVDLWVLDRAPESSQLEIAIHDGDREVFREEYTTASGSDKFHRPGLLAKKTSYTVVVTRADGSTKTETVTVREGIEKLVVRITEDGQLAIAVS